MPAGSPTISVVIEGYNEAQELGTAKGTLEALRQQDYPLREIEVILVGSPAQAAQWSAGWGPTTAFTQSGRWRSKVANISRQPASS